MSVAGTLPISATQPDRSVLQTAGGLTRLLTPSRLVAAIALGLANTVFVALTYGGPAPGTATLPEIVVLFGAMAATVFVDRAGHRRSAWILLAAAYALVVLAAPHQPTYARDVLIDQVMSHALALAVAIADRRVARRSAGRLTYVIAGLTGVAAGALLLAAILHLGPDLFADDGAWSQEKKLPWFRGVYALYTTFHWLLFGGAAVLFYGERRLAEATMARLRAAELDRSAHARQVVESALQLMQARIEPQFLFNTLLQVKELYQDEPQLAERMLDELGAFLRAAMPHMRDSSSTVGQELDLARAYLAILRIRLRDRLHCVIAMPPELAGARLPSMMVLPLVDRAVAHATASPGEAIELHIAASLGAGRLRLMIATTARRSHDSADSAVVAIRERLDTLYCGDASLTSGCSPTGRMQVLLDIPFECAPDEPKSAPY